MGDTTSLIHFDYPLSERMRTFLRLDLMFSEMTSLALIADNASQRAAFSLMAQIITICGRGDLKSEIIKELDRLSQALKAFRQADTIDSKKLEELITSLSAAIQILSQSSSPLLSELKEDDFFTTILSRFNIPGGTLSFDLPEFHLLMNASPETCRHVIDRFDRATETVSKPLTLILHLLRYSFQTSNQSAIGGLYTLTFDQETACQLVRISINKDLSLFPEVSGGRQRINIRFFKPAFCGERKASNETLPFIFSQSTL